MLRTILILFVVIGVVVFLAGRLKFPGNESGRGTSPESETANVPERVAPAATPVRFSMGDTVKVGYWTYRCNRAGRVPFVGHSQYDLERADATFIAVDLTIENNDRTPSTFPPPKLIDSEGREYEESSKAFMLEGAFNIWKKLNPDVSSRGLILFDVPDGRKYTLVLSGGFRSRQTALIDLMAAEQPPVGAPLPDRPPADSNPLPEAQPQ